jgi:hypothetical protein
MKGDTMTTRARSSESAPHGTADDYEAQQLKEWTTYVARVPIDHYGVRAYNAGDPVPLSAVQGPDAWIAEDFVDQQATAFEGSATVVDPAPPTIDPSAVGAPPVSSPAPIVTTEG